MAEDPGQIREAIEQTRAEIGETAQAIGQKADVKGRASKKVAASRDQLKASGTQAQAKLVEAAHHLEQRIPPAARPAVAAATQRLESPGDAAGRPWWRQRRVGIAIAALTAAGMGLRLRRGRSHK